MNDSLPTRIAPARISDEVAKEIETRILEGVFKAGERLPPERQFATDLGVSRSSLREAIQKLESRGLLNSRQGGGTFVTGQMENRLMDPWLSALGQHPHLREDIFEFREMVETRAGMWAAQRATDADHVRLKQLFDQLEIAYRGDDRATQIDADVAFHQGVADAAHNLLLSHLNASMQSIMHEHIRQSVATLTITRETALTLTDQHRAILNAILHGDSSAADNAVRDHIAFVHHRTDAALRDAERRQRALRRLGTQNGNTA